MTNRSSIAEAHHDVVMGQETIRPFEQVRSPVAALPLQPSIETGFPYGKDPFILVSRHDGEDERRFT